MNHKNEIIDIDFLCQKCAIFIDNQKKKKEIRDNLEMIMSYVKKLKAIEDKIQNSLNSDDDIFLSLRTDPTTLAHNPLLEREEILKNSHHQEGCYSIPLAGA